MTDLKAMAEEAASRHVRYPWPKHWVVEAIERALTKLQEQHEAEREDNEAIGAEFLETLKRNDPSYCWSQTPTEWIVDQINKYDDLKATTKAERTAAVAEALERVLAVIGHSEETAELAQPGWETGYAAALRVMDSEVRKLKSSISPDMGDKVLVPRDQGCALAMRVLQSNLYQKLDDKERVECDELIERWRNVLAAGKTT